MVTAQLVRTTATQVEAAFRTLSSITPQQAETIVRALQAGGYAGDVETINDYDGCLSVLIEPRTLGDDRPAYFVTGANTRALKP